VSALKFLSEGTTAQDFEIANFFNIFNEDYRVYELHYDSSGSNNGSFDLGLLTDEGVPLSARQSFNNRYIYSHTSTSDSNAQNQKQTGGGLGQYKYNLAIARVFSPFQADNKTTITLMHMGYSSTSVVASVPTFGNAYEPSKVTGISIIPEYSAGNAGTLRVYGVA
tara:strand:+ start:318 stop:815 length:498 start_codon:yes stop_codon:yes gene_type:complete